MYPRQAYHKEMRANVESAILDSIFEMGLDTYVEAKREHTSKLTVAHPPTS